MRYLEKKSFHIYWDSFVKLTEKKMYAISIYLKGLAPAVAATYFYTKGLGEKTGKFIEADALAVFLSVCLFKTLI